MQPVRVDTPPVQDVVEDSLSVDDVIVTRGEGAGVLRVAAVSAQVAGRVTRIVRVQARVTRDPQRTLARKQINDH